MRLFSTEQVSKYHPDKCADQISDAVVDACLAHDRGSRVACECLIKDSTVVLGGEITSHATPDYEAIARRVAGKLGYPVTRVISLIERQSPEIAAGIDREQGAGDQGMMFGYATDATASRLPFGFDTANRIISAIEDDIASNPASPLRGDAKTQVTVDFDRAPDIHSVRRVLVSVCHTPMALADVRAYMHKLLLPFEFDRDTDIIINPAGEWTIGGPAADCGLTGRKIVCDQYGGYSAAGGGAFSGKDPSKVDRSGAYMARKIAVDLVERFELALCKVQIAYAIGMKDPMSVYVSGDSHDAELGEYVRKYYDLTPAGIIRTLHLLDGGYESIAEGCHFRSGSRLSGLR